MKFIVGGFGNSTIDHKDLAPIDEQPMLTLPRKSLVQVYFPGRNMTLSYYNDQFDLTPGDLVYVEGKLAGKLGRVTQVNYNFKIKVSDYKRVISLVDTDVHGEFFQAGSHFVTFDSETLSASQVLSWFRAPEKEEDEFVRSTDDSTFLLEDLTGMHITAPIAERGHGYYIENRVRFLSIRDGRGFAIVEGSANYVVEFSYSNGEISQLVCDCPCADYCKHEFAAMLQLRETLGLMEKNYPGQYGRTGYFAAISKGTLFAFAIDRKETGSLTLQ